MHQFDELNRKMKDQVSPAYSKKVDRPLTLPFFPIGVQAGFPSPIDDLVESSLDLNQYLIQKPAATYFVRAKGNSMIGAGIFDGDILIVDKSITPKNGSVVIASIDGEFTVKRLVNRPNEIVLEPDNINYSEIKISSSEDFQIWGVVTHSIHSL